MAIVQYKQGTSALNVFNITLDDPPATDNSLVLAVLIDRDETVTADYDGNAFSDGPSGVSAAPHKLALLFLLSIAAGSDTVTVTRAASTDSVYCLYEVSGLVSLDASADAEGSNDSPSVSLAVVDNTCTVGAIAFTNASALLSYGGDAFETLTPAGSGTVFLAPGTLAIKPAATYTYAATLSGSDDWIAVLISFVSISESVIVPDLAGTAVSAATPPPRNGFTGIELERAFRGADSKFKIRVRGELLDPDLVKLYDLKGMLQEGQVSWTTDAAIKGAAQLKFLEVARDSQHSAPLQSFANTVLAQNRLFWLRLGETSGNFADSSGNSRTFTANGTITYSVGSLVAGDPLNNAIKPNGTTGYASIADAAWMDVSTITLVVAWSGTGVSQTLIDRDDGGSNRFWRLDTDSTGLLQLTIKFTSGSPNPKVFIAPIYINDGQPHLIHAIYDKQYVSLYVDGARVLHTAETRTMATGTLGINIARNNVPANYSSGIFDEAGMLGRALTPREIRDEYQAWSAQLNELLFDRSRGDRVKVYYAVKMSRVGADGSQWAEYAQGVYLLPTLSRQMDSDEGIIDSVSCQDQSSVLNDAKFGARYTVTAGTNFITAILTIAQSADFNTSAWAVTTNASNVVADIDFELDSSKLEAINYLLTQINYKPLRFNGDGAGVLEPNALDTDIPVALTLIADETSVILVDGLTEDIELRKVPTTVIVATGNPDTPDIQSSYTIKGGGQVVYRDGYILIVPNDVPDQTTADALAKQLANNALAKAARRFKLQTYPRPLHGDRDKIHLTVPQMSRDADFIEDEITLPLSGAAMQRSILSVLNI